jgi:rhamnogalacturonyl hydrolase YesR
MTLEAIKAKLPAELPTGIAAIIKNYLDHDPLTFNTDWFGTMPLFGLLRWAKRGVPGTLDYAKSWFEAHVKHDPKMTDEAFWKTYGGHNSRVIRMKHLPITTYCGLYGLAYPCHELFLQTGDERARETVLEIGQTILHKARRHGNGLLAHDDHWDKAIPDACFFNVEPLMRAAQLDDRHGEVYQEQAVYQLRTYIDIFLDRSNGLAKTMLHLPDRIGSTYWCRASGWLMWSFVGVMRFLPPNHPAMAGFKRDLKFFAAGVVKALGPQGCIHGYANDHSSPPESTGTAMCVISIHEAVRNGWIPNEYGDAMNRMWQFCKKNVTDKGAFESVYYEWAMPAEDGYMETRSVSFGPHIGALLWLADEMTT